MLNKFTFPVFISTLDQVIDAGDGVYLDIEGNYVYKPSSAPDVELLF